jgi:hypothetical protein
MGKKVSAWKRGREEMEGAGGKVWGVGVRGRNDSNIACTYE